MKEDLMVGRSLSAAGIVRLGGAGVNGDGGYKVGYTKAPPAPA